MVARVSAADGLVALTGPLVRVAPALLLEVRQEHVGKVSRIGIGSLSFWHCPEGGPEGQQDLTS